MMTRWYWRQVETPEPFIDLPDDCVPVSVVPGLAIGGYLISYWEPEKFVMEDEPRSTG